MREILSLNDVAGDVMKKYGDQYNTLLKDFNDANANAAMYKDDIKIQKMADISKSFIDKAQNLKQAFMDDLMKALNAAKEKATNDLQDQSKVLNSDKVFSSNDNMRAMQLIYMSASETAKLTMLGNLISIGYIPAIEQFLNDNITNTDVVNVIEAYIKTQPDQDQFVNILSTINDSKITPADDINKLIGQVNIYKANFDIFPAYDSVFDHHIKQDFSNEMSVAKSYYFNNNASGIESPYFK